jgi:hypothetical protein
MKTADIMKVVGDKTSVRVKAMNVLATEMFIWATT